MNKRSLRSTMFRRLQAHKEAQRRRKSRAIHRKLLRLAAIRKATLVVCYVSLPYEVETRRLIQRMLALGKRVAVPKVWGASLRLFAVSNLDRDLAPGAFNVPEPTSKRLRPVALKDADAVVVPGLAFDRRGHRLGHGLGYFDRFLARLPKTTPTIGLCFEFQLLDRLPTRPHDRAVHTVLSA